MDRHDSAPAASRHLEAAKERKQLYCASELMMRKELEDLKKELGKRYTPQDGLELLARLEEKQRNVKFYKGMRPVDVDSFFPSRAGKRARRKRLQELCYSLARKGPAKKSPKSAAANDLAMPVS